MRKRDDKAGGHFFSPITRRTALKGAVSGAAILAVPVFLPGRAQADGQYMELESIRGANIDWRQAEGASITVGVIPAGYFKNLETVLPDFIELTGIDVRFEMTGKNALCFERANHGRIDDEKA